MRSTLLARALRIGTAARLGVAIIVTGGVGLVGCSGDNTSTTADLVSVVSGSGVNATVGTADTATIVALVTNGDSKSIAGVTVSFAVTGGATLSSSTAVSDADGYARVTMTMGTHAGVDSVTATIANATTPPAIFTVNAMPGAPTAIVAEAGNTAAGTEGSYASLVALITDQYGNPVPDAQVDWTATAGTLVPTDSSDVTGTATDVLQFPNAPAVITATATVDGTALKATFTDTVQ